jgi:hypothetical protein
MWNLSSDDVRRAKERISRDRAELESHYHERMKVLDAAFAEIETVERVAAEFAEKHLSDGVVTETTEAREGTEALDAVEAAEGDEVAAVNGEGKTGSRWRLHLGNRAPE